MPHAKARAFVVEIILIFLDTISFIKMEDITSIEDSSCFLMCLLTSPEQCKAITNGYWEFWPEISIRLGEKKRRHGDDEMPFVLAKKEDRIYFIANLGR